MAWLYFALGMLAASLAAASGQIYQWTTIAGSAGSPGSSDGTNSAARFRQPQGVAVDWDGNVYIADTGNSTIRKLAPFGTNWVTTTIAGIPGSVGSADGTNGDARFYWPEGVGINQSFSEVFVADTFNHTIRMLIPAGTNWVVSTIAGQAGVAGSEDGANGTARFSYPAEVALGDLGPQLIFVADTGNSTIRMITPSDPSSASGWVVRTLVGFPGMTGSTDGTNSAARFRWPAALAVASPYAGEPPVFHDLVLVADTGNSTIREFDVAGFGYTVGDVFSVRTLAGRAEQVGSDDGTNSAARSYNPAGIAVDDFRPQLFIADWRNSTIRLLTLHAFDWSGDQPLGTNWEAKTIGGVAGYPGYADGTNSQARFYSPQGIAVDQYGRVFASETQNHTIRMGVPIMLPPVIQSVTQTNGGYSGTFMATKAEAFS